MQKYIGRIVVLFTPIFVAGAAVLASQAQQLPGHPQLDQTEIVAVMVLAATSGIGAVVTWLVNLGKHERQAAGNVHSLEMEERWAEQREADRLDALPAPGSFDELLSKPMAEAVPLLREHLGLEAEIPQAELVLSTLAEVREGVAGASAAIGAVSERLDAIEANTPESAERGGDGN